MNTASFYRWMGVSTCLLALGWMGCSKTNTSSCTGSCTGPDSVVAKVGDKTLTMATLNQNQAVYAAQVQFIDQWLEENTFGPLAKAAGKPSIDALFDDKFAEFNKVPATEAEARAAFAEVQKNSKEKELADKTFEEMKDRALVFATQHKALKAFNAWKQEMQAQKKAEMLLAAPPRINVAAEGPSKGPKDAKVTIVEFSDFQCPYCSKGRAVMEQVVQKYGNKVRLVFRDYPLPSHKKAQKAAEAGQCAHVQGKFWPMHDWMFDHQGNLDVDSLKQAARTLGLDSGTFDKCLDSGAMAGVVTASLQAGEEAGVKGTPAFFVNGLFISGAQPLDVFVEKIDAELAKK